MEGVGVFLFGGAPHPPVFLSGRWPAKHVKSFVGYDWGLTRDAVNQATVAARAPNDSGVVRKATLTGGALCGNIALL